MYRATGRGATITGLAQPIGLSIVYMDVIPLFALVGKLISPILPANFQYFGLWSLLCYALIGGLAAVILEWLWHRIYHSTTPTLWRTIYLIGGTLLFISSPMLMARTMYHPALGGQWLILLGFLIVIDTPQYRSWWRLMLTWCAVLVLAILIHPYFLPMLGAIMLVSIVRYFRRLALAGRLKSYLRAALMVIIPSGLAISVFYLIGGFSQSGAEIYDLSEKGFNLLSFANPYGYSRLIPGFQNASSSPETMMWLGLGAWAIILLLLILSIGRYRTIWHKFHTWFNADKLTHATYGIIVLLLLVFAVGVRVDLGPITLFQFTPPTPIYRLWTAFRAAAREAWPLYYLALLIIVAGWLRLAQMRLASHATRLVKAAQAAAFGLLALGLVQIVDISLSPNGVAKHDGIRAAATVTNEICQVGHGANNADDCHLQTEYETLDITKLLDRQQNLIALDDNARGEHAETYIIGRTALKYHLKLGVGFYARVPRQAEAARASYERRALAGALSESDLTNNLFYIHDEELATKVAYHYKLEEIDGFWFIASPNRGGLAAATAARNGK